MAQGRRITSAQTDRLLAGLRLGMTRRAATAYAGFSRQYLYEMMERDPTLLTAIEKAEGEAEAAFAALVAQAAAVPKNWTAAAWWLERRKPADYARRERMEVTGQDGGPITMQDVGALRDHERAALVAAIQAHLRGEAVPEPDPAPAGEG